MVRHFEEELDGLKSKLLEMSMLVTTAIHRSIEAVVERDEHLAEEVLRGESRVNEMEIEIDDLAIQLFLKVAHHIPPFQLKLAKPSGNVVFRSLN